MDKAESYGPVQVQGAGEAADAACRGALHRVSAPSLQTECAATIRCAKLVGTVAELKLTHMLDAIEEKEKDGKGPNSGHSAAGSDDYAAPSRCCAGPPSEAGSKRHSGSRYSSGRPKRLNRF